MTDEKTKEAIKKLNTKAGLKKEKIKKKKKNFTQVLKESTGKDLNDFLRECPIFYDEHLIWWAWNKKENFWEMIDAVDILNIIADFFMMTAEQISPFRNFLLNVMQQKSRKNKPKELPEFCIQFKDKIVDLKNKTEIEATPKYFSTAPIFYELSKDEETPIIDKLFQDWVGEKYVKTLYEILAYSCLREQFLQTFICLTGSGSNGKGTFQNLIVKFLGEKNCCSSSIKSLITRSFETSALYKKLLCLIGEVDSDDLKNTNIIKQLTGEDLIRYEFKGKTCFSEKSGTTFIIATNSLPRTPDKSDGFYRRAFVIDFPNQFPVKRDLLAQIPEQEFRNLTRKVVNCLYQLLEKNEFTKGGDIEERRQRYEERSNPLMMFITEKFDEGGTDFFKLREFANSYNLFLKEKKLRQETISKIGKMLRDEGFEISPRKFKDDKGDIVDSAKSIIGLKIKNDLVGIGENGSLGSLNKEKLPKLLKSTIPSYENFCFRCGKRVEKDENLRINTNYYCSNCFKIMEGVE